MIKDKIANLSKHLKFWNDFKINSKIVSEDEKLIFSIGCEKHITYLEAEINKLQLSLVQHDGMYSFIHYSYSRDYFLVFHAPDTNDDRTVTITITRLLH